MKLWHKEIDIEKFTNFEQHVIKGVFYKELDNSVNKLQCIEKFISEVGMRLKWWDDSMMYEDTDLTEYFLKPPFQNKLHQLADEVALKFLLEERKKYLAGYRHIEIKDSFKRAGIEALIYNHLSADYFQGETLESFCSHFEREAKIPSKILWKKDLPILKALFDFLIREGFIPQNAASNIDKLISEHFTKIITQKEKEVKVKDSQGKRNSIDYPIDENNKGERNKGKTEIDESLYSQIGKMTTKPGYKDLIYLEKVEINALVNPELSAQDIKLKDTYYGGKTGEDNMVKKVRVLKSHPMIPLMHQLLLLKK